MTASILAILAAVVPFAIWLWRRRVARSEIPEINHKVRYETINRDIISGASKRATEHATDDLERLERMLDGKSDPSGPTGSQGGEGKTVHG